MIKNDVNYILLNSRPLVEKYTNTSFSYIKDEQFKNYEFKEISNKIFKNNIVLIDSDLPKILASIILYSFLYKEKALYKIVDLLEIENPLGITYFEGLKFYRYKIKELMRHLALGLNPKDLYFGEPNIYNHYPLLYDSGNILYFTNNIDTFLNRMLDTSIINVFVENFYINSNQLNLNFSITV